MSNSTGPLYESTYVVSTAVRETFESWLNELQRRSMREPGVDDARGFEDGAPADGGFKVVFRWRATDDTAMDALLDDFFAGIELEVLDKFGDDVSVSSRVLREDTSRTLPDGRNPNCLNCGTPLLGQYCGSCGQRSRTRLISIWELLKDAFGDLFELDSRLWKTLGPLLVRPGRLTRDYLEGRRARYMPPFRTYLVLSLIFFVVAFFNPREDLSIFFEAEPPPTEEELAEQERKTAETAARQEQRREEALERVKRLNAEGKIPDEVVAQIENDDDDFQVTINGEDGGSMFDDCENASIQDEDDDFPDWIMERFTDERLKVICERNKARGNDSLVEALLDNIPVALIVLLPMMALVLKILYPLSRRYFVEHLLFFVHFHAFFFLILTLQVLFARVMGFLGPEGGAVDSIAKLLLVIASLYIPVYLYKAMRHVYGQGHIITFLKYIVLLVAYLTGATVTMFGAFLIAVLSA